ncbi:MAG: EAL domain-containing protein [Burkholderiales bacterium]|nr:EAL domain-containing protein [Burkholderiales bacterium]
MPSLLARLSTKPLLYAILIFWGSIVASTALIVELEQNLIQEQRARASDLASMHAHTLRRNIEQALSASYALAALVQDGKGDIKNFNSFATQMLNYHPGIAALYLAPDGVTKEVVPVEWRQKGLGIDLLSDPTKKAEAILARDTGRLTLAGPHELTGGGQGIIGWLPVFINEKKGARRFWGLISVVITVTKVLSDAALPQLVQRGYEYELWRSEPGSGRKQTIARSAAYRPGDTVRQTLALPNTLWTLDVMSHYSDQPSYGLYFKLLLGLAFSFMLAYLVKLLQESREQKHLLKKTVDFRTAELAAREADLRRAQAVSKTGSWITDLDSKQMRCSDEAYRILQVAPDSIVNYDYIMSRVHPDDRAAVAGAWQAVLDGRGCKLEHRILSGNGETRWVHTQIELEIAADGKIKRRIGTIQDITERKRVEDDLRIAAIAFEGQEGMVITDDQRKILRINHAFTRITGYSREEAVGKTTSLLKSGLHGSSYYSEMAVNLEKCGFWQGEIWNRRKNGEVYPEWLTITAVKTPEGKLVNYVGTLLDITQRKATEAKLEHLAYHDPLTGLPNRRLLLDRLQHALVANLRSNRLGAILFLDLDNFKTINDTIGHGKGDLLLQHVAKRLAYDVRKGDTLARLGGDEFVLILEDLSDNIRETAIEAKIIAAKIIADLKHPYRLDDQEYHSSASIGIVLFGKHNESAEELLKQVEVAMYEAKSAGGNTLCFFDQDMLTMVTARAAMEADLRLGLTQQQFILHYQAQVKNNGMLIGAEALVRWKHPGKGMISPADFIPLAEESGLILPLGKWVLETACLQLLQWSKHQESRHLTLAVNVSARQFRQADFVMQVLRTIRDVGIDASKLKLELTESLLVENIEETIEKMNLLKSHGVGFSLDDFGTGYSSLYYLKRLPLDQLKIDQSFVRDILNDTNDAVIARTIIGLGQSLGLTVIAEGVETEAQRAFLAQQGCDAFQGYLFGKPSPRIMPDLQSAPLPERQRLPA